MTFAGIWEHWQSPEGSELETAAILTAGASPSIRDIHERMPVVVGVGDRAGWLSGGKGAMDVIQSNIHFESRPVSRAVNNVKNDNKKLIEEIDPESEQKLF